MATLIYIIRGNEMFTTRAHKLTEVCSEILLLLSCTLLQQCGRYTSLEKDQLKAIQACFLTVMILLTVINISYVIYTIVVGYKDKKRSKEIEEAKEAWEIAVVV